MEIQEIQTENRKAVMVLNKKAKKAMFFNIAVTAFVVSVLLLDICILVTNILNKEHIATIVIDSVMVGFVALCVAFDIYGLVISIKNYKEVHREYVYYNIINEYKN